MKQQYVPTPEFPTPATVGMEHPFPWSVWESFEKKRKEASIHNGTVLRKRLRSYTLRSYGRAALGLPFRPFEYYDSLWSAQGRELPQKQ